MSIQPAVSPHFTVREIFPAVWCITEMGVNCYLVAGSERAALIDAGWGFGKLAELVTSLSPLPLTVINTHGHPDHVCGDFQFSEILIGAADMASAYFDSPDIREKMLERVSGRGPLPDEFERDGWVNAPIPQRHALAPDAIIDLGGRSLHVIPTPGHTPGSLCLLDADARLLFSGDTIVNGPILMHLPEGLSLSVYADSLRRLLNEGEHISAILPGHGNEPLPASRLTELLDLATAILSGEIVGEPTETFLGSCLSAKATTCNICYLPEKLHSC